MRTMVMKEAQVFKGTEVKELLTKAIGGIYLGRIYQNVKTDCFTDFSVTDDELVITVDGFVTAKLPIDEEQYINYAVAVENEDDDWDGSTYFDYCFETRGYTIAFNVTDKGDVLAWEQFAELVNMDRCNIFKVSSIDGGSISVSVDNCIIDVEESEITVITDNTNIVLDREVIDAIYNDSVGANAVCYRVEFNNSVPDITFEVEYAHRLFR